MWARSEERVGSNVVGDIRSSHSEEEVTIIAHDGLQARLDPVAHRAEHVARWVRGVEVQTHDQVGSVGLEAREGHPRGVSSV